MYLTDINIDGFGVLSDWRVDGISPGLNVFYGANGAGKTTLLQFLRGMFLGFDEARRLRLLPPLKGGNPGGGIGAADQQRRYSLIRHLRPDNSETVALNLKQGSSTDAAEIRKWLAELNVDRIHTLFTVGNLEAHALEPLMRLARREGIRLAPATQDASWVIPRLQQVRTDLTALHDDGQGRIPDLQHRRDELTRNIANRQASAEQESRELATQTQHWQDEITRWDREANLAHADLQVSQSDLTECSDRLWGTRTHTIEHQKWVDTAPIAQFTTATVATDNIEDTAWRAEITDIDSQIERTRQVLHDLAASRMIVSKEAADHAGIEATGPDVYFADQRGLIGAIEQQLLDWQATTAPKNSACRCAETFTQISQSAGQMRDHLYAICQNLGRQQASHRRWLKQTERDGIDRLEADLNTRLQQLHLQREVWLRGSGRTLRDRLSHRLAHEAAHCDCQDHGVATPEIATPAVRPVITQFVAPAPTLQIEHEVVTCSTARPDDQLWQNELSDSSRLRWKSWQAALEAARDARRQLSQIQFPASHDSQLVAWQAELADIERQLAEAQSQFASLTDHHVELTNTHRALSAEIPAPVIQEASQFLSELTQGRYQGFRYENASDDARATPALFVYGPDAGVAGDRVGLPMNALSRGTLDQAALSMRLALAAEYTRRGFNFPMVLDDILVDSDELRLRRAAELICHVAGLTGGEWREASGHSPAEAFSSSLTPPVSSLPRQILFLTCQERLAALFETLGASVSELPGSKRKNRGDSYYAPRTIPLGPTRVDSAHPAAAPYTPTAPSPARTLLTSAGQAAARSFDDVQDSPIQRTLFTESFASEAIAAAQPQAISEPASPPFQPVAASEPPPVLVRAQPEVPHWLRADSSLSFVPSLGEQMARRLGTVGVRNVADLVSFDPEQSGMPLDSLQISAGQLRTWQSEARLLTCVIDLTGRDAQILVAAGIHSPQELGEADPETLGRTIRHLQSADAQTQALLPWIRDVTRWPDEMTLQRWIAAGRHARTFRQATDEVGWKPQTARELAPRNRQPRATRSQSTRQRKSNSRGTRTRSDNSASLSDNQNSVTSGHTLSAGTTYHLHEQSPIVDAPSIGPKSAERLEKVGLLLVGDLLSTTPEKIAERLDDRRVTPDIVRGWQQQARLVCRIPGLRGHDAQILVACGITEADDVAQSTPESLLRRVEPFAHSKEGQRVLRSSKVPDLEEVTEWITAAKSGRQQRAA